MIKFVLGLIALVFVGLAVYVYTDKENKPPREHAVHKTVKQETPSQKEVSVTEPEAVVKTEVTHSTIANQTHNRKSNVNEEQIALEVKGEYRVKLDDETIRKIESEVKGEFRVKLDDETIRKIESEVKGEVKLELDDETIRKIESEVKSEVKPQLTDETIRKIESEVKNTILDT